MIKLKGLPASPGKIKSQIKLLSDDKSKHGILVAQNADPSMAPDILKSYGVVTERGGSLCHTAIFCRELGLPCVVGVEGLLESISENCLIEIDGSTGEVIIEELE